MLQQVYFLMRVLLAEQCSVMAVEGVQRVWNSQSSGLHDLRASKSSPNGITLV